MIAVKLMGGMGNQMFQYAFARHLALIHNTELFLDLNFLLDHSPRKFYVHRNFDLDIFNINAKIASDTELCHFDLNDESLISRLFGKFIKKQFDSFQTEKYYALKEFSFHFNSDHFKFPNNTYIEGYWQSELYFKNIEDVIRNDFKFKNKLSDNTTEILKSIENSNSVCINIRRGYVNHLQERYFHGFAGIDYINSAKNIIKEQIENPHYFIFSDDIDWCREHIKDNDNNTFVGHEYKGDRFSDYLLLMTKCKHFIIPNSSFGWWGAWLSENKDKLVIAPKKWFRFSLNNTKDLCPASWIRI